MVVLADRRTVLGPSETPAYSNKVSSWRDVTLLARRRVLPLVSYVAYASVTDDDRRRQTPATVTSLAHTECVWRRASSNYKTY